MPRALVHATALALAVDADGPLFGLALTGEPGAGKSRLAAALVAHCPFGRTRLTADDAVALRAEAGRLVAEAPTELDGTIEVFGTGLARLTGSGPVPLRAALHLGRSERLPAPERWAPLGSGEPCVPLYPCCGDPAGVLLFLRSVTSGHSQTAGHDAVPASSERS